MRKAEKHSVEPTEKKQFDVLVSGMIEVFHTFDGIEATSPKEAEKIASEAAAELSIVDWDMTDPERFEAYCEDEDGY
jgi:hypothetical protein